MACVIDPRMMDLVWTDRFEYEALFHKRPAMTLAQPTSSSSTTKASSEPKTSAPKTSSTTTTAATTVCADGKGLLAELEAARGFIRASLETSRTTTVSTEESLLERATRLEGSNATLKKLVEDLSSQIERLESKLGGCCGASAVSKPVVKAAAKKVESDDDDFNFSDDDEEDAPKESEMQKMKRLATEKKAADEAKKAAGGHVGPITKSNVVLDCKPWDDETDLVAMEKAVRGIAMEGLRWGDSKLVEVGYGIQKLRISTCIIDHLVGLYDLEELITNLEDFVQSVDIVSHNKI